MNNENKHLSVKEYKEVMHEINTAQNHLQNLNNKISEKYEDIAELDNEINKRETYEPYWQRIVSKIIYWIENVLKIKIPFIKYNNDNTYEINENVLDDELNSLSKNSDDYDFEK